MSDIGQVWIPGDSIDFCRGVDAPKDADPVAVLDAFLCDIEGLSVGDLTDDERDQLLGELIFMPLWSVVKADHDDIGDEFEWHTDGHGKRRRDAWWMPASALSTIYGISDRLRSARPTTGEPDNRPEPEAETEIELADRLYPDEMAAARAEVRANVARLTGEPEG